MRTQPQNTVKLLDLMENSGKELDFSRFPTYEEFLQSIKTIENLHPPFFVDDLEYTYNYKGKNWLTTLKDEL